MNIVKIVKTAVSATMTFAKTNAPALLTATAAVGVVALTGLTVKATIKSQKMVKKAKEEKGDEPLTKKETVKIIAKSAWPAAVAILVTCGCVIASNVVSTKRAKALAIALSSANAIAENALNENSSLRQLVEEAAQSNDVISGKLEEFKESKKKQIETQSAECPPMIFNGITETGHGNELCRDVFSGQMFKANREWIECCLERLNSKRRLQDGVTYGEWLDLLGITDETCYNPKMTIGMGEMLGWGACYPCTDDEIFAHVDIGEYKGVPCWYVTLLPEATIIDTWHDIR